MRSVSPVCRGWIELSSTAVPRIENRPGRWKSALSVICYDGDPLVSLSKGECSEHTNLFSYLVCIAISYQEMLYHTPSLSKKQEVKPLWFLGYAASKQFLQLFNYTQMGVPRQNASSLTVCVAYGIRLILSPKLYPFLQTKWGKMVVIWRDLGICGLLAISHDSEQRKWLL